MKWEYMEYIWYDGAVAADKILAELRDHRNKMNTLGSQGWELVAVVQVTTGLRYEFKRPVP